MSAETEAECLLRSGTLYRRRAGFRSGESPLIFVGVKRGAFSVYEGDEPIYHFDLDGRWQRAYVDGTHFRKALDGSIDAIERPRVDGSLVLVRRRLAFAESRDLDEAIRQRAIGWELCVGSPSAELREPPNAEFLDSAALRELFHRAAGWDAAAWFAQRERFLATYAPLGFLPPDDHQSVVLQATIGDETTDDHWASRTPDEFQAHCRAVKSLLGRRLAQNRDVFLGGGRAVRGSIESYFEIANQELPIVGTRDFDRTLSAETPELGTINLYAHDFRPGLPDGDTWKRLKSRHLGRVTLGIASGDDRARDAVGVGGTSAEIRRIVEDLKEAEIDLAVIVLVGLSGRNGDPSHLDRTVELIRSFELARGDFVYLINADEWETSLNAAPNSTDFDAERSAFKERLLPLRQEHGVKIVPYSKEKQWN